MYSPKIDEEFIPPLYRIAKSKGIPMTRLVNQILSKFVKREKNNIYASSEKGGDEN